MIVVLGHIDQRLNDIQQMNLNMLKINKLQLQVSQIINYRIEKQTPEMRYGFITGPLTSYHSDRNLLGGLQSVQKETW